MSKKFSPTTTSPNPTIEISTPSGFQHVGGAAYNTSPPMTSPPSPTYSSKSSVTVGAQLHRDRDPKSNAKSTIISNKLRKFFTHRPSRDSLYERHILNAPYGSGNLSFYNIFKIIVALKKSNVLDCEGIFRVNGNAETIRTLWLSLNTQDLNLNIEHTAHDLAGLLKLYLRESRFPLIPIELFPNNSTPVRLESIKEFITKLPNENVKILHFLIEYLEQVTNNSSVNKMNPIALGVCFGPNIIRSISNNPQPDSLTQIQTQCNMITALIENREFLFSEQEGLFKDEEESTGANISLPLPPPPIDDSIYSSSPGDQYINELPPPPPPNIIDDQLGKTPISPLYDELTNVLIEDITQGNKDDLINRMTNLFLTDPDNFKAFLKEILGVDGLISLLEVILTLE